MRREIVIACVSVALVLGTGTSVFAQQSVTTVLLSKDVPEVPGKEVTMSTVLFPAGVTSPVHRHDAHTLVYVLEGTVEMQVAGGPVVRLGPGQTFYETPDDVHVTSRNVSTQEPARILVFMLKDKGKPAVRPAN